MAAAEITHVIFDCDGLLLDTESIYSKVISELCTKHGHEFNWEVKSMQMGHTDRESGQILIDYFKLPITVEDYCNFTAEGYVKYFPASELMPGAEKLVRHLHNKGVPIAVATGGSEFKYNLKITNHKELFSLFSHIVFASDDPEVTESKPAPDVFNVCAKRFPAQQPSSHSNILVFEDAPNGVISGHTAGMPVVWVPDSNMDINLAKSQARIIIKSLNDFKPEDFGLPPYDS